MSLNIDDFIKNAIPEVERKLARVNIAGGDRMPFYSAQLRSFFREEGTAANDDTGLVTSESFGLRSLLVDATTTTLDARKVHSPTLLRVYPRPREFLTSPSRLLFLWSTEKVVKGDLQEANGASDLLVTPFEPWPVPDDGNVKLPPLRLVDGRAEIGIDLNGELGTFLSYKKTGSVHSIFAGLKVNVPDALLKAALVPKGIEFEGSLPDPTRDFGGGTGDRIEGMFRLECDTSATEPAYLLRLVTAKDQDAINKTEDRIALAMAGLAGSPVAIRFDKRPDVPPLFWPLDQAGGALELKPIDQDFEMRIEATAVDVRIKTEAPSSEERGLATILAGSVEWKRQADLTVELAVLGGTKTKDGVHIDVAFKKAAEGWETYLGPIQDKLFTIPLQQIAERLLPIYKAGGGLPQDATYAPYVFLPVQDGWLQIELPKPSPDDQKRTGKTAEAGPGSAMSGRVFVAHSDTNRGVVLDDAVGIDLRINWKAGASMPVVDTVALAADGSQGQVLGMLYASESSPNAREALPTVKGGPASTRDLPLWFGAVATKPRLEGEFDWTPANGQFTARFLDLPVTPTDENNAAISWVPPANSPYISNFPLTRALPSAPEPSVSRGLIPRRFGVPATDQPIFTLKTGPTSGLLPKIEGGNPSWFHFLSVPEDKSDRLILPTLAGTEFRPAEKSLAIDRTVLRFDLPILDELFACSDPQTDADKQPRSMSTALQLGELALSWNASRDRMARTRTQAAEATEWIELAKGVAQKIEGLVAPYVWLAEVNVKPDANKGWGQYVFAAMGFEDSFAEDKAVEGLGGDKPVGPVGFAMAAPAIIKHDAGPIQIAGFAANLYPHKVTSSTPERLWDSRGFGLTAIAENGIREAAFLDKGADAETAYSLLTSPGKEPITVKGQPQPWAFAADLCFLVRDLPLKANGFDGTKDNTPEGVLGTTGKAFDQENFPTSLYEWRLFELPEKAEPPKEGELKDKTELPRHDIRWGPFVFKPLRLREAKFGTDGKPTKIVVLGGMRFDYDGVRARKGDDKDGPFGPDEVHQRNDLFTLTLTLVDGKWGYAWAGVRPSEKDGWPRLDSRNASDVEFQISLADMGVALLKSTRAVPATIRIDVVGLKAAFEFRLFGSDHRIEGAVVAPTKLGFNAKLPFAVAGSDGLPTGVLAAISEASISIEEGRGTLLLDGTVNVHALVDGKPSKTAIVTLGKARFDWLGVVATKSPPAVKIDHATGELSWCLNKAATGATSAPFDFPATGLDISATLVAVASQVSTEVATTISPISMSSAWMQVCATDHGDARHRMLHTLLASEDGERDHALSISWSKEVESLIAWPEFSQLKRDTGENLTDWLEPANAKTTERSRKITITADANSRLQHQVTFHLKAHRLDGDSLTVAAGMATVSRPVRLLAVAKHRLGSDKAWSEWTTLDHIVITTPTQIAGTAKESTFAPLQNGDKYRNAKLTVEKGIAAFPLVLSGFFDTFLIQEWWKKATSSEAPVMLGGAVAQFPLGNGAAHTAVVPWLDAGLAGLLPKGARLNELAGAWRVPSADLWPATPLVAGPMPTVVIGRLADSASIQAQFGAGRFSPDGVTGNPGVQEVIPVEQAYFEKRNGDAVKPLDPVDLKGAPFFLRAMVAIASRRDTDSKNEGAFVDGKSVDWNASTIQTGRFLALKKGTGKPAVAAISVKVRDNDPQMAEETQALVFADLFVLSRNRATRLERYRRIVADTADDLAGKEARDEIAETASDVDADVMIAVRVSEMSDGHLAVALRTVPRPFGNLQTGKPLTLAANDIGASAALGWPTALGTEELAKLGPALGTELPLLGHESGFAARFQIFGWPAFGPAPKIGASPDPNALYVSFANQITYDRGTASKLGFDGPTARHLMPAPVRRRAPVSKVTKAALAAVLRQVALPRTEDGSGTGAFAATEHARAAAILPPIIERGTIGRRPGVMEVAIASMTIPADDKSFDEEHDRFGRPANSGPVAAHQLRNPRSPVLPADRLLNQACQLMSFADSERITFGLRRRTYVSLADLDKTTTGRLDLFLERPELVDAARFETDKDGSRRHDRALFTLKNCATIDASWNGLAEVAVEVASRFEGVDNVPKVKANGRIEVGQVSSPLKFWDKAKNDFFPTLTFAITDCTLKLRAEGLGAIQAALREATADTPLRLVLDLKVLDLKDELEDDQRDALPQGPHRQVFLPMKLDPGTRRVLPVRSRTIVFGDPSYDRQLASQTSSASPGGGDAFLLAADRVAYDPGSMLYFAAGNINASDGEFVKSEDALEVSFARLPPQTPTGDQPPPQPLGVRGVMPMADGAFRAKRAKVIEIGLGNLIAAGTPPEATATICPLLPGDRLQIVAVSDGNPATLQVDIVAEPVIAPPPSVYSVVETSGDIARVRLHAAAPLPQKIEFPDLLKDLALGHVRRRALFVWSYALVGAVDDKAAIDLLKFDRSGGAQIGKI